MRAAEGLGGALLALTLCLAASRVSLVAAQYDYQWRNGRASYYGTDGWSIHKGNCGFGYINQNQPAGWDVVALSDQFPSFPGSCGRCYEVRCDPRVIKDGYGSSFDRTNVCKDTSVSLLVRVVDSCPCNYPTNWYSNKRWCCGDVDHMDMSIWAFEKLTDKKWGVMAMQYRAVPCNYRPQKPAPNVANPTPGEYWSGQPNFMDTGDMKTPKIWNHQQTGEMVQGWKFGDPTGSSSSAQASATATAGGSSATASSSSTGPGSASASSFSSSTSSSSSSGTGGSSSSASSWSSSSSTSSSDSGGSASSSSSASSTGDFGVHSFGGPPEASGNSSGSKTGSDSSSSSAPTTSASTGVVYQDSLQNSWYDASYSAKANWKAGSFSSSRGNVVCANIYSGGAFAVSHAKGGFQGFSSLEWWVKTDAGKPQFTINIGGGMKYCSPITMASLPVLESRGGFSKYSVHLGSFGGSFTSFAGCGGGGTYDLTTIEMKSTISGQQTVCLDSIQLLGGGSRGAGGGSSSSRRLLR